ncbi:MAG: hypothetical protein PHS44_07335 [Candidatus Dojkabacteria bacterium]|nr:hypothetical protein [Candidatus Dojkabacteria bacterium]
MSEFAPTTVDALSRATQWNTPERNALNWVEKHVGYARARREIPTYDKDGSKLDTIIPANASIRLETGPSFIRTGDRIDLAVHVMVIGPLGGYCIALYSDLADPSNVEFQTK